MKELVEKIAAEIKIRGIISFAQFMRMALYCPNYGFYETETDTVGRKGSFYTSVSVGKLFGQLLAVQFSEWLGQAEPLDEGVAGTGKVQLAEAGAHNGALAKDILDWLRMHRAGIFERVEYCILEPSARRRSRQAFALQEFGNRVRWSADWDDFQRDGVRGVIFSNELLDAMPMHRVSWDAKQGEWFEWGVALRGETFEWARMEKGGKTQRRREEDAETRRKQKAQFQAHEEKDFDYEDEISLKRTWLHQLPAALLEILPDGFTTEVCPEALRWWKSAARALRWGRLMTIDYGFTIEELLAPERKEGTLRGYRNHRLITDVLTHPGKEDLTAHVNFAAVEEAGITAGLTTELFTS